MTATKPKDANKIDVPDELAAREAADLEAAQQAGPNTVPAAAPPKQDAQAEPGEAVVRFSVSDTAIAAMKSEYDALIAAGCEDEPHRALLTKYVRCRTAIDKERKVQNENARKHIENVNGRAKEIEAKLAPFESDLQKRWDDKQAEKQRIKDEAARKAQEVIDAANRKKLEEEKAAAQAEHDKKMAEIAEKQAEQDARQKKLDDLQAKMDKDAADRKAKADAEAAAARQVEEDARKERQRLEDEAREKQRLQDEADRKAAKEKQDKIDAEQKAKADELAAQQKKLDDAAAELKAKQDAADRAAYEAKVKADAEAAAAVKAKKDAEDAAAAKVEADRKAAEAAAKVEAMKPDLAKLKSLAVTIRSIKMPDVKSKEAKEQLVVVDKMLSDAVDRLDAFKV